MSHHLPSERKKKRTRRSRRKKRGQVAASVMAEIDPQPMPGSTDPLRRKARLAEYMMARTKRMKPLGAKTPTEQSQDISHG